MAVNFARASSQYATTGSNFGTGSFTIEFWGYPHLLSTTSNYQASTHENNHLLGLNDYTTSLRVMIMYLKIGGSTKGPFRSDNHIAADSWYYFKFTHNTSTGAWTLKCWDSSKTLVSSGSGTTTTGARDAGTSNAWHLFDNDWGGNVEFWGGYVRNFYVSSAVESDTDSQTRMEESTISTLGSATHIFPLVDASDTSDSVGSVTLSFVNSPTTAPSDPPWSTTYTLAAAEGSFTLTGEPLALLRSYLGTLAQGAYTYTGYVISFTTGKVMDALYGAYTYTGETVSLARNLVATLAQGAYSLTGEAVSLLRSYVAPLAQGAYSLTGYTANLFKAIIMALAQGAYTYTGEAAAFAKGFILSLAQGAYSLSGYVPRMIGFVTKFVRQNTSFTSKYTKQNTTFADKFTKQNTVFEDKFQ